MLVYLILISIFLALSAFFSAIEAAIFSISRFRLKTLLFEGKRGARILEEIKKESGKTLASILFGNLLVNIGASSVGAIILVRILAQHEFNTALAFICEFIIMTSLLLIIGEITPKTIALANAEFFALKFSRTVYYLTKILNPISGLMEIFARSVIASQKGYTAITEKEIRLMLSEAHKFKILDAGEIRYGNQILEFSKMKVGDIMTPRQKVVGICRDVTIEEARKIIISSRHSRICVFDKEGGVIGILYAKDLFISQIKMVPDISIESLMRAPYVVPETKPLDSLLGELRKKGIHISVVLDDVGRFTGIVTLDDIVESLYGEIIDEYDEAAEVF